MTRELLQLLQRYLRPIVQRLRSVTGQAVLSGADDGKGVQTVQATSRGDAVLAANRVQDYGFTSVPLPGAIGIFVAIGGSLSNPVFLAFDDPRYRKKTLAAGEVAVYHHEGDYIRMKNGRVIEVFSGTKVQVTAPAIDLVAAGGTVTVNAANINLTATSEIKMVAPSIKEQSS